MLYYFVIYFAEVVKCAVLSGVVGGVHSLIWPIQGYATGRGQSDDMVSRLLFFSALNRVSNFM